MLETERTSFSSTGMGLYRLQEDEGLSQQIAQEMIVGQTDTLKVSGGVDLLKQLRELRLQDVHLETKNPKHLTLVSDYSRNTASHQQDVTCK